MVVVRCENNVWQDGRTKKKKKEIDGRGIEENGFYKSFQLMPCPVKALKLDGFKLIYSARGGVVME
jgi:hypothetical protein